MTLTEFIRSEKQHLIARIEQYGEKFLNNQNSSIPYYEDTLKRLVSFAVRGKMIRGLLIPYTYRIFSGNSEIPESVWKAAVVIEIMHAALLIHDDIIDNDFERRGNKSLFAQYSSGKTVEYGKNMALCAGDCAFFMGFAILSEDPDTKTSQIINLFSKELLLVGIGEMQDVSMAEPQQNPSPQEIETMYLFKTARYTFSLPFLIGALYAEVPQQILDLLEKAGEHIGVLFQMQDDELGITGTLEETGKPVGSDIREGKKTISRHVLFHSASPAEQPLLKQVFGNKDASEEEIQKVIQLYESHQIPEKIHQMIESRKQMITQLESEVLTTYPEGTIFTEVITILENRTK